MAEVLDLAQLPMSDREELQEVDHDRDAALPATATLADGHQDAIVRHLDELEWLVGQGVPGAPVLLRELDELRDAPKGLRGVWVGPLSLQCTSISGSRRSAKASLDNSFRMN